jgi:hypothetical protein
MAKKRKTRNQKILADNRHVLYHHAAPLAQNDSKIVEKETVNITNITLPKITNKISKSTTTLSYVGEDIKKISLISAFIITLQITLFFLLQRV